MALDRDVLRSSKGLWIAIVWMLLIGSRTPSQWLGIAPQWSNEQFIEGDPVERWTYGVLFAVAITVLFSRRNKVWHVLRSNWPIVLFFLYCALSIGWADYPGVAFKRWIKAAGDVAVVLVVLTDRYPKAAVRRLLSRVGLVLMAASILLIRYFVEWGRVWNVAGEQAITGVTTDKNMLGMLCMIYGIGAVWRILHLIRERHNRHIKGPMVAQGALLLMVIYLLAKANSMTSNSWFFMASLLMVVTFIPVFGRQRFTIHLTIIALLAIATSALFFHVGSGALATMGRDPTLTGRTELWAELIHMNPNPLVGTGFESFWMGRRLEVLWSNPNRAWRPNEAHNGYLEVYLNLGIIGLSLLAIIIVNGYRHALRTYREDPELGRLQLAFFLVGIGYSCTEAGFRMMTPVWIFFMIATSAIPRRKTATEIAPAISRTRNLAAKTRKSSFTRVSYSLSAPNYLHDSKDNPN